MLDELVDFAAAGRRDRPHVGEQALGRIPVRVHDVAGLPGDLVNEREVGAHRLLKLLAGDAADLGVQLPEVVGDLRRRSWTALAERGLLSVWDVLDSSELVSAARAAAAVWPVYGRTSSLYPSSNVCSGGGHGMFDLAAIVVANFLLPYIKDGVKVIAEKVSETAGEAAGEEAVSLTKRVWAKVHALFQDSARDSGVIDDFQSDPDATAAYLEHRLKALLKEHPEVGAELTALVQSRPQGQDGTMASVMGNSGITVTVTGSTLTNSVVSGGGVNYGVPPTAPQ